MPSSVTKVYDRTGQTSLSGNLENRDNDTITYILSYSWNTYGITQVSNSIGGTPIQLSANVSDYFDCDFICTAEFYDVSPQTETITGFYLDGTEYTFGGSGGGEWGSITGTLSDQTDLNTALTAKANVSDVLTKTNTTSFTPSGDYQPATKKYVDDHAGTEYDAGQGIAIGGKHSDMQGPAPDGFHVPLTTEWQGLKTIMDGLGLTTGNNWKINLHMPFAGNRNYSTAAISNQDSGGYYWSSSPYGSNNPDYAYNIYLIPSYVYETRSNLRTFGFSVRCFKDSYETPTSSWTVIKGTLGSAGIFWNQTDGLISITNGTTGYTIMDKNLGATTVYNNGNTLSEANCGKYYQCGNNYGFARTGNVTTSSTQVDASTYGPGNYYSSSTFITGSMDRSSVHNANLWGGETQGTWVGGDGNTIVNTGVLSVNGQTGDITIPQEIHTPGLYWNEKLGLISISGDGATWMTLADKNLGATKVAKSGEAMSQDNMGNLFQWGNNYPFPFAYPTSTSTSTVNASSYGPNNYYSNSTFRKISGNWDSSNNANLWGGTETNYIAKKGPCQFGWHIPTQNDIYDLMSIGNTLGVFSWAYSSESNNNFERMLFFYGISFNSVASSWATTGNVGSYGYGTAFLCEQVNNTNAKVLDTDDDAEGDPIAIRTYYSKSYAGSIRPFKNEGVTPTTEWTVIMQRIENKLSYSQLIALGSADNILSEINKDPKGYWESLVASGNIYESGGTSGWLSSDGTKGGAYKDGNNYIYIHYGASYPSYWGCYSFTKTTYIP